MLTDTKIRNLKPKEKPFREADGGGLYLLVDPSGSKRWQFRFTWEENGKKKRPWQSIGAYPAVSLKDARSAVLESKELLVNGINPIQHHKAVKQARQDEQQEAVTLANRMTFDDLFKLWHQHNAETWSYGHAKDIWERVEKHLLPSIGNLPVEDIKPLDMIHALKKIEQAGRVETTRRVKQYANRIFKFGIGFGYCERNPVSDLPDDIFKKAEKSNYAHVTDPKTLATILKAIDSYTGDISTLKALQMQPYVFLRSRELAGIRWEEIDLDNRLIEIPAERMKKKRAHLIPLADPVIEIIKFMETISGSSAFLFPSARTDKRPLNEQSLNAALHRLGLKNIQTFHGFRHTASTMLNEMGFIGDVIEKQLAHEEANKVRATYNKAQYLEQRKEMMQAWGNYLDGLKKESFVIPIYRTGS